MAELLGAIESALGAAINGIYEFTHSYALAIILLTFAVRALMIPLTVKQIRSMTAMQKLGPEQKKIQAKYKELQKKAKDRMEVQELRLKMNQEVQELFRTHGVSPLGGCAPMIAQFPVFIAMIAIVRASIIAVPVVATTLSGGAIPANAFAAKDLKTTVCRPFDIAHNRLAPATSSGPSPTAVQCDTASGLQVFKVGGFQEPKRQNRSLPDAGWITTCRPRVEADAKGVQRIAFECTSATGTGHLPRTGKLFADVTIDKATIFGMHAGCSPDQASNPKGIRECTARATKGSQTAAIPYYLLVFLIVVTQYFQSKQMAVRATGAAAQQQQMMTRIFPVFFGFISLRFPTGANLYFLVQNVWMIGQQHILFKRQDEAAGTVQVAEKKPKRSLLQMIVPPKQAETKAEPARETPKPPAAKPGAASKKRKRKKKR